MAKKSDKNRARQTVMKAIGQSPAPRKSRAVKRRNPTGKPEPAGGQMTTLLGGLPDGICIFDKAGVITYCNASFSAISGLPLRKLTGRKLRKNALWGVPGKDDEFRELWRRVKQAGRQLEVQAQPITRPGQPTRFWNLKLTPYLSKKKRLEGMNLQIRDVTEEAGLRNRERLMTDYYAAALMHQSIQPLLDDLVSLLKGYSRCPFIEVIISDTYGNRTLKAMTGQSPGLWDANKAISQPAVEMLFSEAGAEFSCGEKDSLCLGDTLAIADGLVGSLRKLVNDAMNSYGCKSLALIPVRLAGKITGYILLISPVAGGITPYMVETIESVSGHLQVVIEHAELKDEVRRQRQGLLKQMHERAAHLEALSERLKQESAERKKAQEEMRVQRDLAVALNGIENLDEALKLCLDTAILVSGMDCGGIYLADPVALGFNLAVSRGLSDDFVRQVTYYKDSEPNALIIKNGVPVYSTYNEIDEPTDEIRQAEGLKGLGVIPVIHDGRAVACLNIASHVLDEIPFNARSVVEAIAADLGTFIAHITDREALKESEERYRTLFAGTPNPILVKDMEGNYIDGNDAALAFLECTREEFLAMNVKNTLPPYLDEDWYANLRKIWEIGGTVERDYYVWGKIKVLELTLTPLQVRGRKIVFGIGRDVTEKKKAEKELRESEEKYRLLVENANEAIAVVQDSIVKYVNDRTFEIMLHSREEFLSRPFIEFIHPDDKQMVMGYYTSWASHEKVPSLYPFRFIDKDGAIKWAEMRATTFKWEGKPAVLVLMTDITERQRAAEALRQSEERYRLLAENSLDVIWTVGLDLKPIYISPSIELYTGFKADEVKDIVTSGEWAARLGMDPKDARQQQASMRALVEGEAEIQVIEYKIKAGDGKSYWAHEKMSILRDSEGKISGIIGVTRDITEQKVVTENLIVADRLVSLGEMAGGLAHEINNPLTAVMGFAYLLQQNPATSPEIREDVESIYKESKRAAEVIKNFLTFSRGQVAEKRAEQINILIENVLNLRQSRMQKENIDVKLELSEGLPSVYCDPARIQQAILNIILNAEYFMYQAHERGTLSIKTDVYGGNIKLAIGDDGPGMSADKLDHLFDPFYTTKQSGEGTGLGLSICHSIVRDHGGRIYVESALGKGAVFTIELPAGQQGLMLT
ncbi:MAG: PAS domain S-box protein [Dehalococcoidia bacterium]|jgi:signal transduction histidine kinase/GAF domain-containing protein